MKRGLKAEDLLPIIDQLSSEEQIRLSYYMMRIRSTLAERAPSQGAVQAGAGSKGKGLANLPQRAFVNGDPEDLVHLDWSSEWKPAPRGPRC